jgi:phosphoglycolate phosphatase
MRQFDLVIFDLDGTLVDSKADIVFCFNSTLKGFGIEAMPEETITRHVGTGIHPLLLTIAKTNPAISIDDLLQEFESLYDEHLTDQTQLYQGLGDVLEQCTAPITILTNKMQRFADKIVNQLRLNQLFVGIYGREAFSKNKPDPLPVLEICRLHQTQAAKTIIIGDTEGDILSGKGAGVRTCAALYGYGDPATLRASKPDLTIASASDLKEILV